MGYLRYPSYYPKFRCTASACTHNCCLAGWEIDIDDGTLTYYQQVDGACGDRLRAHIALPAEPGETAHFMLDTQGRCPFLGKHNLCDIYTELGAEHLCQICTEHPRYYDWFSDGTEAGVGLCCEAAAELILQNTSVPALEAVPDDDFEPEALSEDERAAEHELFRMRDELFHIVKAEPYLPLEERMNRLYSTAVNMQKTCDTWMFSAAEAAYVPNWTDAFWQLGSLTRLLDFFLTLEINEPAWRDLLFETKAQLPELLRHRQAFLSCYQDNLYEYEQLLLYFLYRHFMGARWDGMLCGRVNFALISTCMIQLLDIQTWLTEGCLTHARQIDLCRRYSEEIEYDEENTEKILLYSIL